MLEKCGIGLKPSASGVPTMLRLSGLLLSLGRFWSLPHVCVATLLSKTDKKYLRELQDER